MSDPCVACVRAGECLRPDGDDCIIVVPREKPRKERCPCGKWTTYRGAYDEDGYTLRCHGCLRATARCTC